MLEHKESTTINGQFVRNDSKTGYADKTEVHVLEGTAPYIVELSEKVSSGGIPVATIDGVPVNFIPYTFTPATTELGLDRKRGFLRYSPDDTGKNLSITYTPAGTVLTAAKLEVMFPPVPTVTSVNGETGDVVIDIADIAGLQDALDNATPSEHTHTLSEITDAGTAAAKDTPATGVNAAVNQVVMGDDSRLTDSRTPVTHSHTISDTTGLQAALDGKASTTHNHDADYADIVHTHPQSDITNLVSDLAGKAPTVHTHAISDVTGLQTALDGKASTTHNHDSDYAPISHTHDASDIISGTLADGRLSTNIPKLNSAFNTFTGGMEVASLGTSGSISADTTITAEGSITANGGFIGSGTSITSLNASNISSGTLADTRLSSLAQDTISKRHTQNTDTGTAASSFTIDSDVNETGNIQLKLGTGFDISWNATTGAVHFGGSGASDVGFETGTVTLGALSAGSVSSSTGTFTGAVTASSFSGSGASLTSLPAAQLTGSIADARLSSNIPRLDASSWTLAGGLTVSSTLLAPEVVATAVYIGSYPVTLYEATEPTTQNPMLSCFEGFYGSFYGGFIGDGSAITAINASNISSGTLADTRLSSNVPLKNAANTFSANQTVTGTVSATLFSGSGASLTSLPAGNLTGSIADARLSSNVPRLNAANTFSYASGPQIIKRDGAGYLTTLSIQNTNATGTAVLEIKGQQYSQQTFWQGGSLRWSFAAFASALQYYSYEGSGVSMNIYGASWGRGFDLYASGTNTNSKIRLNKTSTVADDICTEIYSSASAASNLNRSMLRINSTNTRYLDLGVNTYSESEISGSSNLVLSVAHNRMLVFSSSKLDLTGVFKSTGKIDSVRNITANATLNITDYYITVNITSANITITLPSSAEIGQNYWVTIITDTAPYTLSFDAGTDTISAPSFHNTTPYTVPTSSHHRWCKVCKIGATTWSIDTGV